MITSSKLMSKTYDFREFLISKTRVFLYFISLNVLKNNDFRSKTNITILRNNILKVIYVISFECKIAWSCRTNI